jgi:hypothetical protein
MLEHRSRFEPRERHDDAGGAQEVELAGRCGLRIDADEGPDAKAEPAQRERPVRDAAAEPPAARVLVGDVARRGADDEDILTACRVAGLGRHDRLTSLGEQGPLACDRRSTQAKGLPTPPVSSPEKGARRRVL